MADAASPLGDGAYLAALVQRATGLEELKAALLVALLAQEAGTPGVALQQIQASSVVRQAFRSPTPRPLERRLNDALEQAVGSGLLLRVAAGGEPHYFPATAPAHAAVARLRASDPAAPGQLGLPEDVDLVVSRPNAYALYEQYIGPLTPLLAEQLRDAERTYPLAWIEEAIMTAAGQDRRSWRYIEAILNRWQHAGGPDGIARRRA